MTPRVTVLLPAFNAAATIGETVDSVLAQTFPDFELLIIDDGSRDATPEILAALRDPRIRLLRNPGNMELAATLNRGLSEARGTCVARIDADDLCEPRRLAAQVEHLDAHPTVDVLGSGVRVVGDDADGGNVITFPAEDAAIRASMLFRNPLAHPTVMVRAEMLRRHALFYDESIRRAQDYDLWARCLAAGLRFANLPTPLVRYRVHAGQATRRESAISRATAAAVRLRLLGLLGVTPTSSERAIHERLALNDLSGDPLFTTPAAAWLERLFDAAASSALFSHAAMARVLTGRFVSVVQYARSAGFDIPWQSSRFAPLVTPGAL